MESNRETKKLSFACDICRRRKVKCNGGPPTCNRCAVRGDTCRYSLNPTLSYTARLEQRIRELEAQLQAATAAHPRDVAPAADASRTTTRESRSSSSLREPRLDGPDAEHFDGLKVDPKGAITYHGTTSFFKLPGDRRGAAAGGSGSSPSDQATDLVAVQRRERLVANAWRQRALEDLSEIPEPFQYLLNLHWCWIQPMFNFIYRPAFTRDIETLGPYYSHTLMNAVLSHSVRWARGDPAIQAKLDELYDGGALFGKHARSLVLGELTSGAAAVPATCSVPTVQALLLLSAQECSAGHSAQAWIYSGLAFRLIDHLGICVDGRRYPSSVRLTDEDVEIRQRLFWSCYLWDKMVSLYLGRLPTLQHSSVSPPQLVFDDSADTELWVPFGVARQDDWEYPPTPAYSTSCFTQMCRLSLILNELLVHMYDPVKPNSQEEMEACLTREEPALRRWWDDLPPPLRIDTAHPPALAPPSHIVTLNTLYHTITILLHRPMLFSKPRDVDRLAPKQHHLVTCVSAATSIISIFELFCRSFGIGHSVLSLAYSVYIASSIFLLQIQSGSDDGNALHRLEYCVRMLVQAQSLSPVLATPLTMINRQLVDLGIDLDVPGMPGTEPESPRVHLGIPDTQPPQSTVFVQPGPEDPVYPPELFQFPLVEAAEEGSMPPFDPGVLESMSSIEPMSVRVGKMD